MVSVIVPVFNREKYLRRCIDSIIAQTYCDLEIVLVDDGSTDNSGRICDEYAIKDSRVKVIHQNNSGSSISRIRAIEIAHGDYIQFVDCDDWIESDMVECMLNKATEDDVDIVWCNYISHTPEPCIFETPFVQDPAMMLNSIYSFRVSGCLWNKLYRADLLRNLDVSETDNKEDVYYATQILVNNPSMGFVPSPFYHYDITPSDSLTKKNDREISCIPNYVRCYNYLVSHHCLASYKTSLSKRALRSKFHLLKLGKYKEAQFVLPFANIDIRNYPVSFPLSVIYWFGFNGGFVGRKLISLYMELWAKR